MPMHVYKFRAECLGDLNNALELISNEWTCWFDCRKITPGFPDVEIILVSDKSLQELRDILSGGEDLHVIVETLNEINKYTGERYYKDY